MKPNQKLTININPLVIISILVVIILAMFALWRPWEGPKVNRTITTTGQGEVESIPDELVFTPYFQRTGADSAKLKTELDTFGTKLLADVTKLGINKDDVTLNSSSYGQSGAEIAFPDSKPGVTENTVTLSVTIKTTKKELAQKVQDYLATTDAKGQLTASSSFSKQKRKQLESEARDKATKDARQKAEKTASNLGGSVGKVVTVKESSSQGPVYPLYAAGAAEDSSAKSSLPVTPGKSSVTSAVEVVFELR